MIARLSPAPAHVPEAFVIGTDGYDIAGGTEDLRTRSAVQASHPRFGIKDGEKPVAMTGQTLGPVYLPLAWHI
jgi:hypothetical protein